MRGRRWLLFGLWILALVGISFYGGTVSYGFFFAVTLVPVVCFFYLFCVFLRFRLYQELEDREAVCSQSVNYHFELKNDDKFGFAGVSVKLFSDFSYVEDPIEDMEFELLPGERSSFDTRLVCRYRGEYEVGVKEIVVTDFFGIFRLHYKNPGTIKALVAPRIPHVTDLRSIPQLSVAALQEPYGEELEPDTEVRDYLEGDALKYVNWKVSARAGSLKVRKYIGEKKQGITILLDTHRVSSRMQEYLPVENREMEVMLALLHYFVENRVSVSVNYGQNGIKGRVIADMGGLDAFYRKQNHIYFDQQESLEQLLSLAMAEGSLWESRVLICVTSQMNDDIWSITGEISSRGLLTVLYVVTEEECGDYLRECTMRRRIVMVPLSGETEEVI